MLRIFALFAAVALTGFSNTTAEAFDPWRGHGSWANQAAASYPWHGAYYSQQYRAPVAVVVPPTAHMRTEYSWGVSQNLMYPIHHQFGANAPAVGMGGVSGFRATPAWPSHTSQFGLYYVRGPW